MRDARAGCFNILFITRMDRLMRSTKNLYNTLEDLDRFKVVLDCSEQDICTKGAMGKLTLTLLSGLAEFERELTLERSAEGTIRAKAEGKLCHRPKGSKDKKPRKERSDAGKKKGHALTHPPLLSQPAENGEEVGLR